MVFQNRNSKLIPSQKVDDYYAKMLNGESGWDGPEMIELLTKYAEVLEYANADRPLKA